MDHKTFAGIRRHSVLLLICSALIFCVKKKDRCTDDADCTIVPPLRLTVSEKNIADTNLKVLRFKSPVDTLLLSYQGSFVKINTRQITCECERRDLDYEEFHVTFADKKKNFAFRMYTSLFGGDRKQFLGITFSDTSAILHGINEPSTKTDVFLLLDYKNRQPDFDTLILNNKKYADVIDRFSNLSISRQRVTECFYANHFAPVRFIRDGLLYELLPD